MNNVFDFETIFKDISNYLKVRDELKEKLKNNFLLRKNPASIKIR